MVALIVIIIVALVVIVTLARTIRIVPQAQAGVVERFGRYSRTLTPGLTLVVPFVDRIRTMIDLREQVVSFPPQPVITEDNLVVSIDSVIYFQVTDAKAATYEIAEIYRKLGLDIMKSERPKKLAAEQMDEYNSLLEEQAFPFEEQAIATHEINTRLARQGAYDESVKKRKRQKQTAMIVVVVIAVLGATLGVSRLKPALQSVDGGTIWPDTVKRGSMLRQVRGLGSLVPIPDDVRLIPAETDVRVERIIILPGTPVKADSVIMELSNPQVEQEALNSDLELRSAEADYHNVKAKIDSDLANVRSGAATVEAEYENAKRDADQKRAERRKAAERRQQWADRRRAQPSRDQDDLRGVEQAVREDSEVRAYPVYREQPARAEFPIRLFGDD